MKEDPIFPSLPGFVFRTILTAAAGKKRSFRQDARSLLRAAGFPVTVTGLENVPASGPCLILPNHFTRPGFGAWWMAFGISLALPGEVKWIVTGALTFPGQKREVILMPLSRFFLNRLARVYDLFLMPPMPPRAQDALERAAAVRQVLHYAQAHPQATIGLAPEGRDIPGGGLGWPPPGAGKFVFRLNEMGFALLPVGVYRTENCLNVRFGPMFHLTAPSGASLADLDCWVSRRVMTAIADLLPDELRGEF